MDYASTGKLYIVATPIGNLADISFRAVDVLINSDYILAEDTRELAMLLERYHIKTPSIPYTDQKHKKLINKIIDDLEQGLTISLVSDSGTPVVSDPGFKLVNFLQENNHKVIPIPGPNAAIAALSTSGLPSDKFTFLGFLPKKGAKRTDLISRYGNDETTLIIYESSHKIKKLIKEAHQQLGARKAVLANDLTKKHELVIFSNLRDLQKAEFKEKGEFVLLIAKEDF